MAVAYRESPAPSHLAAHVAAAWEVRADADGVAEHRVVPDGAIDLVQAPGAPLRVAGPATGPSLAALAPGAVVRGLRLRPGATRALLGLPAHALLDASPTLAELGLEELDLAAAPPAPAPDRLAEEAVRRLADPRARVGALAADLGTSERQLLRRVRAATGLTPVQHRRIARLQRALGLAAAAAPEPVELAELALDAGYADQAHLTGDVSELCGLPPGALLRARRVVLA